VRVSRARPLQISSPAQTPSTRRSRSFTADAPSEMPDAVGLAPSGVRPCWVAPGWVAVERGGGGADEFQGGCASGWPSASASGGPSLSTRDTATTQATMAMWRPPQLGAAMRVGQAERRASIQPPPRGRRGGERGSRGGRRSHGGGRSSDQSGRAGSAGPVTSDELQREGHRLPVAFRQQRRIRWPVCAAGTKGERSSLGRMG